MQASSHSDQPLTGHSDLSMSKQPHLFMLPHSNPSFHCVSMLNSKPIGLCTATTSPHTPFIPSWGLYKFYLSRKDRYPSPHSWSSTLFHLYLPQQFSPTIIHHHFLSPIVQANQQLPWECQSSDAEPQHAMTAHNPTTTAHVGK